MFSKHRITFGGAAPFISVLQMVKSHSAPHVNSNNPKCAPTSGTYLPHDDDKCRGAAKSKAVF